MGFPILVRWHLYIESGPRSWLQLSTGLSTATGATCHGIMSYNFFMKPNFISLYSRIWPTWASPAMGVSGKCQVTCPVPRRQRGKGKLSSQPHHMIHQCNNPHNNAPRVQHLMNAHTHTRVQPGSCQLPTARPRHGSTSEGDHEDTLASCRTAACYSNESTSSSPSSATIASPPAYNLARNRTPATSPCNTAFTYPPPPGAIPELDPLPDTSSFNRLTYSPRRSQSSPKRFCNISVSREIRYPSLPKSSSSPFNISHFSPHSPMHLLPDPPMANTTTANTRFPRGRHWHGQGATPWWIYSARLISDACHRHHATHTINRCTHPHRQVSRIFHNFSIHLYCQHFPVDLP